MTNDGKSAAANTDAQIRSMAEDRLHPSGPDAATECLRPAQR